jgi:hypothetical protein
MLQRRAVLAALTSAMAAAMAPTSIFASNHQTCRQRLAGIVGDTVRLSDQDGRILYARVLTIDDGPTHPGLDQFSIVFEGDDLVDGLYEAHHRDAGTVPVALIESEASAYGTTRKRAHFSIFI